MAQNKWGAEKRRAIRDNADRLVMSVYVMSKSLEEPFEDVKAALFERMTEKRALEIRAKRLRCELPGGP